MEFHRHMGIILIKMVESDELLKNLPTNERTVVVTVVMHFPALHHLY